MAHRIAKKTHPRSQQNQPQKPQSQMNFYQQPEQSASQTQTNKMPRPLLLSSDAVYTHDKMAFKQGRTAFPQPQALFVSGNNYDAGPEFLRPTSAYVFSTPRKTNFPLGVWITPFGSDRVHKVRVNSPLRCSRCKAYVNGYFRFDGTKTNAICNICGINFSIDHTAIDANNLNSTEIATEGVIDFVVRDKIFMKKRTDIVKILVVVEVNNWMMESNAFSTIMESTRAALENGEFQKNVRIGFVLFNGQGVTYLKLNRSQNWQQKMPKKYTVKYSTQGLCCPLSDKQLLFDPNTENDQLLYMIECIKHIADDQHKNSKYTTQGANYAVVLKTIMQNFVNEIGRVMMFSNTAPRAGPMGLRARTQEDNKLPLKPLTPDYFQLSKQLVKARIGVDMYIISKQSLATQQLPTTHFLASHTGGTLHLYSPYIPENHSQNLYYNIYGSLTRRYVYDVNFTARLSNGLNVCSFGIADGIHETRDLSLGMMDSLSSVSVNFQHQQKIEQNSSAFIQFAIMFTTGSGDRIIRILNYRFQLTNKLELIHEACDYLTVANMILRQATHRMVRGDVLKVREDVISRVVGIVGEYVLEGGSKGGRMSQLLAHPNLAPALAYIHSFINSRVFLNQMKIPIDFQICDILKINSHNFFNFANNLYPKLFSLGMQIYETTPIPGDLIEGQGEIQQSIVLPPSLPLTAESITKEGVYLHWAADYLVIIVQPQAPTQLLLEIFGTDNWDQLEEMNALPELESAHNIRLNLIIEQLRRRSSKCGIFVPLLIRTPKKKGPYNDIINMILKEDILECKYLSFLQQVHRGVQGRLK